MTPEQLNEITAQVHAELLDGGVDELAKAYKKVLRGAGRRMARRTKRYSTSLTAAFVPPNEDEVIPRELLDKIGKVTEKERQIVVDQLASSYARRGVSWDVHATVTPEMMDRTGLNAAFYSEKLLRDAYRSVLEDAVAEGWSIPKTATEIVTYVDGVADYQATALARTDLVGLSNASSQYAATKAFAGREDVTKVWLATDDDLTRETHVEADGQEVGLNEPFTVGGVRMPYPGFPLGPPEEVINCRCTLIYNSTRSKKQEKQDPLSHLKPSEAMIRDANVDWSETDPFNRNTAERAGISWDEVKRRVEEYTRALIKDAPVRIRTHPSVAEQVIEDGRFKSQFEAGTSEGLFSPDVRSSAEHELFGYRHDLPDKERPIYGYLGGVTAEDGPVGNYGDVVWQLKPSVRARTTFVNFDSLNMGLIPSPVENPSLFSLKPGGSVASYLGNPNYGRVWSQDLYWEAQVHGGVTLDDVESVTINYVGGPGELDMVEVLAATLRRKLASRRIPVFIRKKTYDTILSEAMSASSAADDVSFVDVDGLLPVAAREVAVQGQLSREGVLDGNEDPRLGVDGGGRPLREEEVGVLARSGGDQLHQTQLTPETGHSVRPSAYPADMATSENLSAAVQITVEEDTVRQAVSDILTRTPWEGVLAIEGHPTSDGRYLLPGEIGQRDLPLPFAASHEKQRETETAGRIETIEWIPVGEFDKPGFDLPDEIRPEAVVIWGTGSFSANERGQQALDELENGVGVSLDLPIERRAIIDAETYEEVDPSDVFSDEDLLGILFGGMPDGYLQGVGGKIGGVSLASIAAFEETTIRIVGDTAIVASGYPIVTREPFDTTALLASSAPLLPPRDWFFREEADEPTPITILPSGEFFGHLALWNTCHAGRSNGAYASCMYAPHSRTNYSQFHLGAILCDDGTEVPIGRITIGTGHAPLHLGAAAARKHYDHSGTCVAFARAKDGVFGIWLSGVIKSDATAEAIRDLRACPPSGDWRAHDGVLELQAALAVNAPGYPVPRSQLSLAASADSPLEVATLILGPPDAEDRAVALQVEYGLLDAEGPGMLVDIGAARFELHKV